MLQFDWAEHRRIVGYDEQTVWRYGKLTDVHDSSVA